MISRRIVLHFPPDLVDRAVIYRLVKDYELVFNILKAQVLPRQESYMVMELSGSQANYRRGIRYLKDCGIIVKSVEKDILRNDELCYHCGACTAICPTDALRMHPETMEVLFDNQLCTGCALCMPTCPSRAMQVALI